MAGKIKKMIDDIIEQRAGTNQTLINTTRTKLLLKGIDAARFTASSPDDLVILAKLQEVAQQLNIVIKN